MVRKFKSPDPLLQLLNKKAEVVKPKSLGSTLPKLFSKNPEHRFGTCWKCGCENEIPGGDFFKCANDGWLVWKPQMSLEQYTQLQAQILESGGQLEFEDADVEQIEEDVNVEIVQTPESLDVCSAQEESFDDDDDEDVGF